MTTVRIDAESPFDVIVGDGLPERCGEPIAAFSDKKRRGDSFRYVILSEPGMPEPLPMSKGGFRRFPDMALTEEKG